MSDDTTEMFSMDDYTDHTRHPLNLQQQGQRYGASGLNRFVFFESQHVPAIDLNALNQSSSWQYLGQGTYNLAFRTQRSYRVGVWDHVWVRKESFPDQLSYVYRAISPTLGFSYRGKDYVCEFDRGNIGIHEAYHPMVGMLNMATQTKRLYIYTGTGLYVLSFVDSFGYYCVTTNAAKLYQIDRVLASDPRDTTAMLLMLPLNTLIALQEIAPEFPFLQGVSSVVFNQKLRTVWLFSIIYPRCPVFILNDHALMMKYFAYSATVQECITEIIRIFVEHDRIVTDACTENFRKDADGTVYCCDLDMAIATSKRRPSKASDAIYQTIIEPSKKSAVSSYANFLRFHAKKGDGSEQIVRVLFALFYLSEQFEGIVMPKHWITQDVLVIVLAFYQRNLPITDDDLVLINAFRQELQACVLDRRQPIYYLCLQALCDQGQEERLSLFLGCLSKKNCATTILNTVAKDTFIIRAVKQKQVAVVKMLLQYGANPQLPEQSLEAMDAIDWAMRTAQWDVLEAILLQVPRVTVMASNRPFLWSTILPPVSVCHVVAFLRDLDNKSGFLQQIEIILKSAEDLSHEALKQMVRSFFRVMRAYILDESPNLQKRQQIFVQDCEALISNRTVFEGLDKNIIIELDRAIGKLDSALFSVKKPTSTCVIC